MNSIAYMRNRVAILREAYKCADCSVCSNLPRRMAYTERNAKVIMAPRSQA